MKAGALNRLLGGFDRTDDASCWPWLKATDPLGYGRFWIDGGMRLAHRVVFEIRGLSSELRTPPTHCPANHEYTHANTYKHNGRRFCRQCHNARTRARKTRLKATVPAVGTAGTTNTTITKEQQ